MENAQSIVITEDAVKGFAQNMNNLYGTKVTVFCEGDFNNYAYIDVPNGLLPIAQGSLAVVYRALKTFDLAFQVGRDIGFTQGRENTLANQRIVQQIEHFDSL